MRKQWQAGLIVLLMLWEPMVWAQRFDRRDVEVEVINDRGRPFPQYPLSRGGGPTVYKAHLEAVEDQQYSIRVRNRSDQRIGVVIAVDGRNIISGDRSNLRSDERMYVLKPGQEETYEGWRSGQNRVNRFYFTDAGDSYAGGWGDRSATGVIAVAAFREAAAYPPVRPQPWSEGREEGRRSDERQTPPEGRNKEDRRSADERQTPPEGRNKEDRRSADERQTPPEGREEGRKSSERQVQSAAPAAAGTSRTPDAPGTGYGETEWSPSRRVEFAPERRAFAQFFLKYAWRDTLCRERVIDCDRGSSRPHNRQRDDDGYASPPPRHRQERDEWR